MFAIIGLIVAAVIAIAILGKKPTPTPTPECSKDSDCRIGMVCKNGVCVVEVHILPIPPTPIPPSQYICSVCQETFLTAGELATHIAISHVIIPIPPIASYACDICGASFATQTELVTHRATIHAAPTPSAKPYTCSICGAGFATVAEWSTHQATVHPAPPMPPPPPIPIPTPPTPTPIPPTPPPTPKEGDKKCDGAPGYRLWVFSSGKWVVQRYQAPECGYVAPPVPIPLPKPGFEETMIKGFVRQRWTDNPISGALVTVRDGLDKTLTTCFTDSDGWFMTVPLKTGVYPTITDFKFEVSATGYKSSIFGSEIIGTRAGAGQTFTHPADMKLELIGYEMPYGAEVAGMVESTTGIKLQGARVIWEQVTYPVVGGKLIPTGVIYTAFSKAYGPYQFSLITPGKYLVRIEMTGYATLSSGLEEVPTTYKGYYYTRNYQLTKL